MTTNKKSTKEIGEKSMIMQQAFFDLADELEKECGDWQQEPEHPELKERILAKVAELEKEKEQA